MVTDVTKRPIDQRVARSRAMLQHALNSLILKKHYDAITIGDICEAANVGRSTFYAHYASKDDLKRRGFEPLRRLLTGLQKDALATSGNTEGLGLSFSLAMFEHARDHQDHYRALVGGHGSTVSLGTIRQILSDLVRQELAQTSRKNPNDAVPRELVVQYVVGAFMAVMTWWLDRGAKLPPERIDEIFRRLALRGLPR